MECNLPMWLPQACSHKTSGALFGYPGKKILFPLVTGLPRIITLSLNGEWIEK